MASEITITGSLGASKGGASVSSGTLSKVLDMTGDGLQVATQSIDDTGETAIGVAGAIGTLGQMLVKNLDDERYVDLSFADEDGGGEFAAAQFARLDAGAFALLKPLLPTGATAIYARAESGYTVNIGVWLVEE